MEKCSVLKFITFLCAEEWQDEEFMQKENI
jgi:hypothetical protein